MSVVFDGEEDLAEPQRKRDTELTLGAGKLLLLFMGLVLVCGLCFGLGYIVGHHRAQSPIAPGEQPADDPQFPMQGNGSLSKPSATSPAAPTQAAQNAAQDDASQSGGADLPEATAAVASPVSASQAPAAPAANPGQP